MRIGLKAAAAVLACCLGGAAHSATLDLISAPNDGTTLFASGGTITGETGTTLFVGDFIANAVCPLADSGCNGIMTLNFDRDVVNVTFLFGVGNPGDIATLIAYDGFGMIIGGTVLDMTAGFGFADLSFFGPLRTIFFDNSAATGDGYAYGDISYELASIPLPATLPLLLAAAAGFGVLRRRRVG